MTEDHEVTTVAGQVAISKQLLERSTVDLFHELRRLYALTPEEIAAAQARREAVWDEKTAFGLVGVADVGEDGFEWVRVERGERAQKWITPDLWARYAAARDALNEVNEVMDEVFEDYSQ